MKNGYRSTEFYITLLSILGSLAMSVQEMLPPKDAVIAGAIASGLYAISRGLAKQQGVCCLKTED